MPGSATLSPPRPQSALKGSSQPELRLLEVVVTEETVEIAGTVSCFYLRQMAQETVKPSADGRRVVNRVRVTG